MLTHEAVDARLFRRLGASRLLRTVCAAATGRAATGLYGKMPGVALTDYVHARLIVVWGTNPSATGIHLVPIVQEAQRRGAKLVVVDPRATPLAKQADLHLAVRPGGDLPVALAVMRYLFENGRADEAFLAAHATGADELRRRAAEWTFERAAEVSSVPAEQIEAFAQLYADSSPAVIRCGWGLERNRNGGSAIASVLALPAVGGKFGVRGGGYTLSNGGAWKVDDATAVGEPEPQTREVNMNHLGEALLTYDRPPVDVLFVYNSNALATNPDQERVRAGLEREDLFTVVFDQVRTDTALYADVLLPATAFPEHHELARGYGALVIHRIEPVAEAPGEARPNYEVFADLVAAARTGEAERSDWVPKRWSARCSAAATRTAPPSPSSIAPASATRPVAPSQSSSSTPSRARPTARPTSSPRSSTPRRRSASTAISPIPPRRRRHWRSSRQRPTARSAATSATCAAAKCRSRCTQRMRPSAACATATECASGTSTAK